MTGIFRKTAPGRRAFMKLCMTLVTASQVRHAVAQAGNGSRRYDRAALVGMDGRSIRSKDLEAGQTYVFHYPYVSTPCFLIDVGEPLPGVADLHSEDGRRYAWAGGVGRNRSVVAFSAICAHKMTHPARSVSFINYRHGKVRYRDTASKEVVGENLIYCCSEQSVYDARRGAMVLGGPAPQPLTTIVLEYDGTKDRYSAVGTQGGEMYDQFFEKFGDRLQLEYRVTNVRRRVGKRSEVMLLESFSEKTMSC